MEKIAVFLNSKDEITTFLEATKLKIFQKMYERWNVYKELSINMDNVKGIRAIRYGFLKLIDEFEDCKIVVVKKGFGIAYSVFYSADFSVWELPGKAEEVLDKILKQEHIHEIDEAISYQKNANKIEKIKQGEYYLDLIKAQIEDPELSSKKALLPFIETTSFDALKLRCCHVPPWLRTHSDKNNLSFDVKKISNQDFEVTLKKYN
ncbi:nitrogenase [Clostridium sp. SHJSY1]|uniref:Fe-only nitrogenase accessory AnfO family protein n=1 Tax=Clostridium sp. SHJSY1 TaxID=2942483 RepID=UPI0028752677|nr:Fe-only nitrogenase accessory AnfO family protein [Clostridium sp. SHJSY1]MDS0526901.1 nitrogenase [Clostridium sp. SHJSY1]